MTAEPRGRDAIRAANQPATELDLAAAVAMTVLCLCWGLQQVAVKAALAGMPPILQCGLRSALAAALVWGWATWRGVPIFARDGTLLPGLLAGALFAAEFGLIYVGLGHTTASRGVLFIYTAPFMVAIGAHVLIPGERLGAIQVLGLVCAFAGVALAFGDALRLPTARELAGDAMLLVAAAFWAATTLLIKTTRLVRAPAEKVLLYQLAVSALTLTPLSPLLGEAAAGPLDATVLVAFAFQTLVVAFASYLAWFRLVAKYPAGRLSAFSFLTPLFGVLAGALLLGERVSAFLVLSLVLVCAGIFLVNRRQPARRG
ncbi:DMT family transporter [Arenibaculum pallidiluteum]|uniref:DMT family transporter n=1 Tax=Arenibaculum pallidiluteum TaxID=2812559 RepID=UPI001A96E603|nr:DMT family transporter [Arenibaculum pallidiluteum]